MKSLFPIILGVILTSGSFASCKVSSNEMDYQSSISTQDEDNSSLTKTSEITTPSDSDSKDIQVALLLDTSNSMDGLIDQAKSRLWNIVNTLTTLKYDGQSPNIEIALYEYGNDGLSSESDYIRQVTPLTQDLDLISEKLFALRTNGGNEFCGAVISEANKKLEWGSKKNMKLIYIAGNEEFTQGEVHYKEAISDARKNDIYINTIFCGRREVGIDSFWKAGADVGEGKYFNIDPNQKVVYIASPYDDRIDHLNLSLNNTYIGYGAYGRSKKENQVRQDSNASSISKSNKVNRAISKSKNNAYNNKSWDIVDRVEADKDFLKEAKDAELPEEMKGMSLQDKKAFVQQKADERKAIQKEITDLSKKRQAHIDDELKKRGGDHVDDLGKAIESSILELGALNGFRP